MKIIEELQEAFAPCDSPGQKVEVSADLLADAVDVIIELRDKVRARDATIAKLPKTADGVPLVQPLELWVLDGYGRLQTGVYIGFEDREDGMLVLVFDAINEGHWAIPVAECFSTREAAEAARDAKTEGEV